MESTEQTIEDKLPPPELPGSMELTRSDMLMYLRKNFDLGKEFVANAPLEEQEELAQQSATRAIIMGDFLHWQMLLHQMSSIRTTTFQGLLPPEDVLPAAAQSGIAAEAPVDRSAQSPQQDVGSPAHAQSSSNKQVEITDGVQQDPASADASESDEELAKERVQRALQRTRELRGVQIELDRVNRLYKRKSPLVKDANEFEALCMSSSRGPSGGTASHSVDDAESDAGPQYSGLVQRQAKLRVQAIPFPLDPESNTTGIEVLPNSLLFYYQIVVENIGDSAVQILGASVMEQHIAVFDGSQGTLKGGFLCRMLPLEIARELDRLAIHNAVSRAQELKVSALDPDCHFIADIGEMNIRKLDRPFSEKMYESIDAGYESDDERDESGILVEGLAVDSDSEGESDSDTEVHTSK